MSEELAQRIEAIRRTFKDRLCIMGHHYQSDEVIRHCDFTGDSLELARRIPEIAAEHIVFCGVSFMGESAALLTGAHQSVYLPAPHADCMMALMASGCHVQNVLSALNSRKKVLPLAYVNTSVGLKAVVGAFGGAVCTSANARTMLAWALKNAETVLFLPDKNLGENTARLLGLTPNDYALLRLSGDGVRDLEALLAKRLLLWPGCCPIHAQITGEMLRKAKEDHPGAKIFVHPECQPSVLALSDGFGSTSFLIQEAERQADCGTKTLFIGTEVHLVERLARKYAEQTRILPVMHAVCPDMQAVTEENLFTTLEAIQKGTATPVRLKEEEKLSAREALTRMLSVCAQTSRS